MIYLVFVLLLAGCVTEQAIIPEPSLPAELSVATFAGGCFWCMESAFEADERISEVISGYSGGDEVNPTYKQVSSGTTGHRESVQVHYDPDVISYQELLDIFWRQINPTDDGGQYVDRGFQYTSAIYYHSEEEKILAEESKVALAKSGRYSDPLVTPIEPFKSFYNAEDYHQDYHTKNPVRYKLYTAGSGRKAYLESIWGTE